MCASSASAYLPQIQFFSSLWLPGHALSEHAFLPSAVIKSEVFDINANPDYLNGSSTVPRDSIEVSSFVFSQFEVSRS